jgi:hypothetical protein
MVHLRDRLSVGGVTRQVVPDREQRKCARKAARKDARKRIPGNPEHPEVPPFVRARIDECVKQVAEALEEHISEAEPHWTVIAASTAQIADADTKIQELKQLLAEAPRPTSSHSAKDAFRLEQDRLARARRVEETQEARNAARAARCVAIEAVNASFHAYSALRMGEEAHVRAVLQEDYLADLLRCHPDREALEKSLKPAIEVAFAEALRELDEAEKPIRNGQRPFGP